jgi:hypothetical protein
VKGLEEPILKRVIRALFDNTVAFLVTPGRPPICMTVAGAMGCGVDAETRQRTVMRATTPGISSFLAGLSIRNEWFDEGGTQSEFSDGPSASGLLSLM